MSSARTGWDSNPRGSFHRPRDFQSRTLSHSVTCPERLEDTERGTVDGDYAARAWTCARSSATSPTSPGPGSCSRTSPPCCSTRPRLATRSTGSPRRRAERSPDLVVGIEARGLIFGAALALELGVGFVPARKPGKLPAETVSVEYELEYGVDSLELHADALGDGSRVLLHDDLIATGGTAQAAARAIEELGGEVDRLLVRDTSSAS